MSNILIIKHGSLGDIAQASGAIQDISENHKNDQIFLLTTKPYFDLFKKNPFIHEVILDKRLPRYNLIYLYFLMRELKKHKFSKVFDLQNSSRSNFYKNILFPKADKIVWSSSITTLPSDKNKEEFDKISVLERFDHQLKESGLNTSNTLKPDFNWAATDISEIRNFYKFDKYILLFPFCSPHLTIKKWPHFNKLIELISNRYGDEYKIMGLAAYGKPVYYDKILNNLFVKKKDQFFELNLDYFNHHNNDFKDIADENLIIDSIFNQKLKSLFSNELNENNFQINFAASVQKIYEYFFKKIIIIS